MDGYDWTQFHVHMYHRAPLDEASRRFATAGGLESFYIRDAEHPASDGSPRGRDEVVQSGDTYHWSYMHDFAPGGTFLAVDPSRLVHFTFGNMEVAARFRSMAGASEVALHQTGCASEDPDRAWQHVNCHSCWVYSLTNLRSVLAHGADLRDRDHPAWNDSVGIGWTRQTSTEQA
ncbi:MAG: hypothetical protein GY946_04150 [bacterium]|nr:hypothetical protein [bacterium]